MLRFLGSEKAEWRKQAASIGLLYVIGIIAFQFVYKAKMRHEEETETLHITMKQYYFFLLFITRRTITSTLITEEQEDKKKENTLFIKEIVM